MSRFQLTREFFIPAGAVKVAHKHSQAVAYVWTDRQGRPCAKLFYGKAAKPVWHYHFASEERRAQRIANGFAHYQAHEANQAERRAARIAKGRGVAVGDVLRTCWGYEQTNVEWFQVVELVGKSMVVVREIASDIEETEFMQGKTVPMVDRFKGEALRRVARDGAVKIDDVRTAWKVEPLARIGDRAVYGAAHYTSYH